ncbi:MAG: ABC transporter ATP-binding protein [Salibacteraceae bacterium]|jgi:ABC-2 type transport system ATP-binding protein|nr:ABC transporter ATP-binding protein [Salibacteraceae bacterium]
MELQIENLKKQFGSYTAVDIDSLAIASGESFGLVGNNGAGKTTLFRCILDLIEPDQGSIFIGNSNTSASSDWKSFTGSYLDENFLVGHLLPEEYFDFVASLHGITKVDLQEKLVYFETLFNGEVLGGKKLIRDLSKGNQKKVGIAAALLFDPKVLILDEPFANLDPSTQFRLKDLLKKLKHDKGVTMLISSHDLIHVTEVCERIVLLEKGKLIKDIHTAPETLKDLENYFAGVGSSVLED